jgi:hyperosmotically inducible periplasmic protein
MAHCLCELHRCFNQAMCIEKKMKLGIGMFIVTLHYSITFYLKSTKTKYMKIFRILPALALLAAVIFTGCKPKDADVKAKIEKEMNANPATDKVMVTVDDGVVTLSGEVADDATKAALYDKVSAMKGVKSVQDNTVVPAPVDPVIIAADDPLTKSVTDATKDYPEISASVNDGVITVTGEITKERWQKLKMTLDGLNPKRVDGSALTIK